MTITRVYLVDDHALVRGGLKALVDAQSDMTVVGEASDGVSAIAGIAAAMPDVIVMDLSMPGVSGSEATQRIKADHPGVRVLVLTAQDSAAPIERLLDLGVSGYLLKRAAAEELCRAIRVVAGGGMYLDPSMAAHAVARRSSDTPSLSAREEEVLRCIAAGYGTKESAAMLEISTRTFETYRARAMDKLGLKTRADVVRYALSRSWLKPG